MNTKFNVLYQNTKAGMTTVGEKWGVLQDYLITVSKINFKFRKNFNLNQNINY